MSFIRFLALALMLAGSLYAVYPGDPAECGNWACEQNGGEDCASCPHDCGCDMGETCQVGAAGATSNGCVSSGSSAPEDTPRCGYACYTYVGDDDEDCPAVCPPTKDNCGDRLCEGDENENTCPSDCQEICANGKDDDNDGLVDCADKLQCGDDPLCEQTLKIKVVEGLHGKPMKYVLMVLTVKSQTASDTVSAYTDSSGIATFDIDLSAFGKPPVMGYASVEFKDKGGVIEMIYDKENRNLPVVVESKIFVLPWGKEPLELVMDGESKSIDSEAMDPEMVKDIKSLSYIYYNTKTAVDYFQDELGYVPDKGKLPVKIRAFRPAGSSQCEACYYEDTHIIDFDAATSEYNDANAPENREWHEFTHHVMNDVYGGFPEMPRGDLNHRGFGNAGTEDSFTEAFAEFWPAVMGKDKMYAGFYNMKSPTKAWENYGASEELALLSLLWDVKDEMDNGPSDLWSLIKANKPKNVKELYDNLVLVYPSDKAKVDKIFVGHGFFRDTDTGNKQRDRGEICFDTNKNKKCDSGDRIIDLGNPKTTSPPIAGYQIYDAGKDEVGTASNYGRPGRAWRPLFWFNNVKLDVKDKNGRAVADAVFLATFTYSGSCEGSTYSYPIRMKNGEVNILFPSDLDSCKITATLTPQNYEKVESLAVTREEMDAAIEADGVTFENFLGAGEAIEREIEVGSKVDFCNRDGKCDQGESGSCQDCYYAGNSYECFNDVDCPKNAICYDGKCTFDESACNFNGRCDEGEDSGCGDCRTTQPKGASGAAGKEEGGGGCGAGAIVLAVLGAAAFAKRGAP